MGRPPPATWVGGRWPPGLPGSTEPAGPRALSGILGPRAIQPLAVVSAASVDAWVADLGLHLFGRVRRDAVTARELPFVKFGLDAELRPGLSVEIAPDSAGPWVLGLA